MQDYFRVRLFIIPDPFITVEFKNKIGRMITLTGTLRTARSNTDDSGARRRQA